MSITKITVNVSDKEITLTLKEAQELYEELRSLFNSKYLYIPPPQLPQSPYKVWESPYTGTMNNQSLG